MAEQETNNVPRMISEPIPFAENLENVECHQVDIATIFGSDGEVYIRRGVKIIARNRRPNSSSKENSSISLRGQCGIVLRGEILNHDRSNDKSQTGAETNVSECYGYAKIRTPLS